MTGAEGGSGSRAAPAANLLVALAGLLLMVLATIAGHGWADRHFLPSFALSRAFQLGLVDALRIALALLGLLLLLVVRPRVVRAVREGRGRRLAITALSASLAVVAAVAVAEAVLHNRTWQATQERWDGKEPLRARDARMGWTMAPNHVGRATVDGREIVYATDRFGYRTGGAPLDLERPTIIFAGESILLGYGLQWGETIPARVQALTGIQTANISVNAHATDQSLLRLQGELPRFRHPVALVIPFVPMLFDRNLDRDRPHLDAALGWHDAEPPSFRLVELARRLLRYRSEAAIEEGVTMTRAVLRAAIALVEARGARAIILVPQLQPEDPTERAIRVRVLDEGHIPYLLVPLDPAWRLQVDRHPDARGADAIAAAIARALAGRVGGGSPR
jgi:hypothetical protein